MRRCITLAACERPKNSRTRAIAALIVSLPAFVLASPVPAVAQDAAQLAALDAKIANLENENATFKKRLRLQALEKENAALKKQLGMADDHQDQRDERPSISTGRYATASKQLAIADDYQDQRDQRDGRTSISREQHVATSMPPKPDVFAAYAMKEPPYPEGAPLAVVAPPPPLPVWTGFYGSFFWRRMAARPGICRQYEHFVVHKL
jgi:hypothetical protein